MLCNNRVLKWWRHKNEISEIMGFVRIFWKNNVQEAYFPKMSISGQIVSEIIAVILRKLHTNPSNFLGGRPKKYLEGFVSSFVSITGLRSQRQFAPKMLIFGKKASWTLFFQNVLTNPIISEISFLWSHTLVLYAYARRCSYFELGLPVVQHYI